VIEIVISVYSINENEKEDKTLAKLKRLLQNEIFGFNSCRYQMLISICFTFLPRTQNYVVLAILRARRGNACVRICTPYKLHETDANSEVGTATLHGRAPGQSSTSGTECHTVLVGTRVQLQEMSQLALDLVASPAASQSC